MPRSTTATRRPAARSTRSLGATWSGSGLGAGPQRERKRKAILGAAAASFTRHGFHETTLEALAERLGVTKPTIYYYVASKEEMLAMIAAEALAEAESQLQEARAAHPAALDALRAFARRYVAGMTTDYGRCLLAARHTRLAQAATRRLTARFRRIDAMVRDVIESGIADGSLRGCDARLATFAFFGAMNGVPHWYDPRGDLGTDAAADALFDVFAHGFAA